MSQTGWKQATKTLLQARSLHDMVVSGSTCYLVGGATDANGTAAGAIANIDKADVYADGSLGDFKPAGALPAARVQGDTIVGGGFIIQMGGQNSAGVSQNTIYVAKIDGDGNLGAWKISTFPKATMLGHRLAYANGFVYSIGGGAANTQECYAAKLLQDGTFGAWSRVSDLPAALSFHAAVSDGSGVFVSGGIVGTTVQDAIYRAAINQDGTLGRWTFVGSMISPRWRHAALVHNGNLYEIGGSPDNVANSALASVAFSKINTNGTLGGPTLTGALFAPTRNAESGTVAFSHGKMVVCGGHLASGAAASTVNVGHVQGDGHV